MNLTEKLNRRYASKMMNGTSIDTQKAENILEAIRLARIVTRKQIGRAHV